MINERLQKYAARKLTEAGYLVHKLPPAMACERDNSPELIALMDVIEDLRQQNRELHDRLLAVYAPTVAQTLPGMPSFQMDYRGPEAQPVAAGRPLPQELPGTQVGDGE